jgi:hypothetical protein
LCCCACGCIYPAFIAVVVCASAERYCTMRVVFALHCLSLVCVAPIELLPFGLARRSVVVWFSTLLTLPTWPGVSAVLPATSAISSVMLVKRLPHNDPSRGVSPATPSAYVIKCLINLLPSPLVIASYVETLCRGDH